MNKHVGSDFDELQLEREAHRKTWRQLEQVQRENAALKKLLDRANERMDELKSGGLSQQDEREAFANRFPESTNCTRLADVRDGWIAGLEYAARPAQKVNMVDTSEQQTTPQERADWIDANVSGNPTLIRAMKLRAGVEDQ